MPTRGDIYEAFREGRWQPEIEIEEKDGKFIAIYKQEGKEIKKISPWSRQQAEGDLREELFRGILEGEYYPTF